MEKKVGVKKRAKHSGKKEENKMKSGRDVESSPGNEAEEFEDHTSSLKTKPKSRKRKIVADEDEIDEFLILSYATLEELEVGMLIRFFVMLVDAEIWAQNQETHEAPPTFFFVHGRRSQSMFDFPVCV